MKKLLCFFLMLIMLACGKENIENGADENYKGTETKIEKEETSLKTNEEKEKFEIVSISANSNGNPRIEIEFSQDIEGDNLDAYVKVIPESSYKVLKDKNRIIINGNFKIGESYKVQILKELKSKNGKTLNENAEREVWFKELEPKLVFSNDGIILPASSGKKIAFKSVNVKKINLTVKKIYENNITQFLQMLQFKGNGNVFDYNVDGDFYKVGDTVFEKTYDLDFEKNVWKQTEIELNDLINNKGMFIAEISFDEDGIDYTFPDGTSSWEKYSLMRNNGRIGKAILLSDMGIIAQGEAEKIQVTVMDILKNEPVKNSNVKLISYNNQVIQEGTTDEKGEISFDKLDNMMYILAEKNGEKSILKFSDSQLSYDGFAVDGVYASKGIKTFIYTDRGIYRPGDNVYLSFIVRNAKGEFPENHPVKINVYNPRGKKFIENEIVKNGKDGFYTYNFKTNLDSETGIWRVEAEIGSEKFVKDISVETVVPYKIKTDITVPEKVNLNENDSFEVKIKSDYLFGAAAEGLKFNAELSVREKAINFEKYKNYIFKNPTSYSFNYTDYKEGALNENGEGTAVFNIKNIVPRSVNLIGIVTTKVIETGGRPVTTKEAVSLNKFDNYIGIKIPEDSYIKSGDKLNLEVIAVSEDGENLVPGRKLVYRVYKNEYSWWWDYDNYNSFMRAIKTDRNTVLLYEQEFTSQDKPYIIDYAVSGNGEIFVEVEDTETKQSTGINLYAGTWRDSSTNRKVDKLKIETEKKSYKAGETAKIIFEGTKGAKALVTVEKEGVILERKWIKAEDIKNIYEIKVTENMFPNAYVTVGLFQDYSTMDNDRPLRLYGAVPVVVEDESTKINIKIDVPESVKPNDKFTVKIKNEEGAKVNYTVAVVDEGILDITGFNTPDPWGYFYQKQALQIQSYDNYSEIIGKTFGDVHQILKTGGDGFVNEMAAMKSLQRSKNMGIEDVQRFKPVAMFEGVLTADENGEGEVNFTMPNYMGAVKVMVVAASDKKYGSAEKEIVVKAPVVMESSLPRTLKIGDEFEIPVSVFALEDNVGEIKVDIDFMGEKETRTITLNQKGNEKIYFHKKVNNEIGKGKIKISVSSKDYTYEEETEININSNNPYIYINKTDILENGKELLYNEPSDYIKGSRESSFIISNAPILAIDHRISWLIRYPYGCAEQTTSAVFPQIYINTLTNNNKFDRKEITGNVNAGIAKLQNYQLYDGSFSYWAGGSTDIWVTNYVGHFLIEAKEKGYYVSDEMYSKWLSFEKQISRSTDVNLNTKVYSLYLLALADVPQISEMNLIYENYFNELGITGKWNLAAAYKLIGENGLAEEIGNKLNFELPKADDEYYRYNFGSELRDKAVMFNAYYTIYGKTEENLYKEILGKLQSDEWLSTQSIGYSLMTLAKITNNEKGEEVQGTISIDDEKIDFKTENGIFKYEIPDSAKTIKLNTESDRNIFVNYYWEGVPVNYEGEDISQNIKIERNYYDIKGNEINPETLSQGDSFWIEVKLLPTDNFKGYMFVDNMALTQILPTGWEIENLRAVSGEYPKWIQDKMKGTYIDYEDIRDDRVMYFFDFNSYDISGSSFFIKVNAVAKGKFDFPGTRAEAMYNNSYQAYLKGFRVEVK